MRAKEELCRELLQVFDVLDPGLSQSRGFTLYQLSLAQLAMRKINPSLQPNVRDSLTECLKCLQFETEGSFGQMQKAKAAELLKNI